MIETGSKDLDHESSQTKILFARTVLENSYRACVAAAHPLNCLAPHLGQIKNPENMIVVGAGKASDAMALAMEQHFGQALTGVVLTRYGHGAPTSAIKIIEAGHPVPDQNSIDGTQKIIGLLQSATKDQLIVGLFSGGGSALLCAPPPPLTLVDKQKTNEALLASGLPIGEMNAIRKHLSLVKGGKLPGLAPSCSMINFLMSDVPSDDLAAIASGPTVGSAQSAGAALAIALEHRLALPEVVWQVLRQQGNAPLKPGDASLSRVENTLVTSPELALKAAAQSLHEAGVDLLFLGDNVEGEAFETGAAHAELALKCRPEGRPLCILSGGETTVTIKSAGGRGGRNTEYLLGFALKMGAQKHYAALAADTDGIDGKGTHAGAFCDHTTLQTVRDHGLDPEECLRHHASLDVFAAANNVFTTGPTQTNVNDFRAIMVFPT